jgi:hypothetical protein
VARNNRIVPVSGCAQLERFPVVGRPPPQGFLEWRRIDTVSLGGGNASFEALNGRDQKPLALGVRPVKRVFKPFRWPRSHAIALAPKLSIDAAQLVQKGAAACSDKSDDDDAQGYLPLPPFSLAMRSRSAAAAAGPR